VAVAAPHAYGEGGAPWAYSPAAGFGFGAAQFERLGQIPNDLGGGGLQAAGSPQSAPPGR
jgi:hypothetical protein